MAELQVSRKEIEECQANVQALILIAKTLKNTCGNSIDELIQVCEFAALSEAGCRLLMTQMDKSTKSG